MEQAFSKMKKDHIEQFSNVKNLDVVYLVDVTASMDMGRHIDAVKRTITSVVEQVSKRYATQPFYDVTRYL